MLFGVPGIDIGLVLSISVLQKYLVRSTPVGVLALLALSRVWDAELQQSPESFFFVLQTRATGESSLLKFPGNPKSLFCCGGTSWNSFYHCMRHYYAYVSRSRVRVHEAWAGSLFLCLSLTARKDSQNARVRLSSKATRDLCDQRKRISPTTVPGMNLEGSGVTV